MTPVSQSLESPVNPGWFRSGKFEFYYLVDDPFENNNLLLGELNGVQQGRYDKLLANVTDLRETRSHAEPEITLSLK